MSYGKAAIVGEEEKVLLSPVGLVILLEGNLSLNMSLTGKTVLRRDLHHITAVDLAEDPLRKVKAQVMTSPSTTFQVEDLQDHTRALHKSQVTAAVAHQPVFFTKALQQVQDQQEEDQVTLLLVDHHHPKALEDSLEDTQGVPEDHLHLLQVFQ
jgi:hypothetical protein